MDFIQCSECEATVDEAKAYCPECGAAMDEEEKRAGISEFDSLMKTQNISSTTQFRLMEQFNLSTIFKMPKPTKVEEKQKTGTSQPDEKPKGQTLSEQTHKKTVPVVKDKKAESDTSNSNKKLYFVLAAVSLFFVLALISVIILSFYLWFYL